MDAVNAALDESQAVADLRLTKQQLQALRLENQHLQEQVFYITQNYTFCIFQYIIALYIVIIIYLTIMSCYASCDCSVAQVINCGKFKNG